MGDWVVESPSFIEQLMSNKIVMLNQNGVNEVVKIIEEKDKEIERLNELVKGLREERDYLFNKTTTESNYEIERLNNIINKFEEWLISEIKFKIIVNKDFELRKALTILQELKGE